MALCGVCGKNVTAKQSLTMMPDENGKIVPTCPECMRGPTKKMTADEEHDKRPRRQSSIREPRKILTDEEEEMLEQIQTVLAETREFIDFEEDSNPDDGSQKRNHKRHQVDLEMEFSFLRDSRVYGAVVLDISQGGVRFQTDQNIQEGHILNIKVFSPDQEVDSKEVKNFIEVRRVAQTKSGVYEVGARFIKRGSIGSDSNRRKHPRRRMDTPLFFRRQESDFLLRGNALDISQGGLRLVVDDELAVDEKIDIMMRTEPPAFVAADLRGAIKVVRINKRREEEYECGCAFTKLKVIPLKYEDDKEPTPSPPEVGDGGE